MKTRRCFLAMLITALLLPFRPKPKAKTIVFSDSLDEIIRALREYEREHRLSRFSHLPIWIDEYRHITKP